MSSTIQYSEQGREDSRVSGDAELPKRKVRLGACLHLHLQIGGEENTAASIFFKYSFSRMHRHLWPICSGRTICAIVNKQTAGWWRAISLGRSTLRRSWSVTSSMMVRCVSPLHFRKAYGRFIPIVYGR